MTSHTLGIFKKIFPAEGPGLLACQLHTGTTFFNYTTPGDATIKTSNNNLYAKDGLQGFTNFSQRWDDGTRNLVTNYIGTRKWPAPPEGEPTLKISVDNANQIIKSKSYIGKTFESFENRPISAAHIATWQEIDDTDPENPVLVPTDYIVWYRLRYSGTTVIFEQNKIIYDPNIDQETIVAAPKTDSVNFAMGTEYQWPTLVGDAGETERMHHLAQQGRILSTNKAGTKTLFFLEIKNASGVFGTDYQIFELTDIPDPNPLADIPVGDKFEITPHSQYIASNKEDSTAATESVSGTYQEVYTNTVDTSPCPGAQPDLTKNIDGDGSGISNATAGYFDTEKSVFLGVAYSKYDDSVLVMDKYTEIKDDEPTTHTFEETRDYTVKNSEEATQDILTRTGISERTRKDNTVSLRINGVKLFNLATWESFNSTMTSSREWSGGVLDEPCTINCTRSMAEATLTSFCVVDLAAKIFVYKVHEWGFTGSANGDYNDVYQTTVPFNQYDRIYCHANGNTTLMKETSTPDVGSVVSVALGLLRQNPTVCVGDTLPTAPECSDGDGVYTCTVTETYYIAAGGICY